MYRRVLICVGSLLAALVVAAPAAASPRAITQASCQKQVSFALVDARTTGCLTQTGTNPDVWTSTDPVTLNGIPLQAVPGTQLQLTGPSSGAPGGKIGVKTAISILGVTIFNGSFDYNLPAGGPGDLKQLAMLQAPSGLKIKGLSVGGNITLEMGKDATGEQQGYTRFQLVLQLPNIFKNGPGQGAGGLTGTVAIRADAAGVHADTLKIEVANAYVGAVLLKNVCLSYVSATSPTPPCSPPKFGPAPFLNCGTVAGADRWDGSALITLPTASKPELGLFAGTTDGQFSYAGGQVTNLGTSVPIAPGVFLDRVGIGVCVNPAPLKIKGAAAIRFGPDFNGTQAAVIDGSIEYVDSRPWVLNLAGNGSLFGKQLGSGYFTYRSDNSVDFGFSANWDFYSVFNVDGSVKGWYQPASSRTVPNFVAETRCARILFSNFCFPAGFRQNGFRTVNYPSAFDVYGTARICVAKIVCAGGEGAVSSVGVAGCASVTVAGYPEPYRWGVRWRSVAISAGAGYRWGSGGVNVMASSCDVGGYRASKSAVIAADGETKVQLASAGAVVLGIHGLDAAPNVVVAGPGGRKIVVRGAGQLERNKYFAVENPDDRTTSVMIAHPEAGTWTVTPLPGSSPIANVSQAPVNPPPGAAGEVVGKYPDLSLDYEVEDFPGDTITFYERGATYEQPLGVATGTPCFENAPIEGTRPADAVSTKPKLTCGHLAFSPAPGPVGKRDIIAVVTNHGEPVGEFLVTTYEAKAEALPTEPKDLKVTRDGTTVTITWAASKDAYDYNVDVTLGDGEKAVDLTGKKDRHIVLTDIPTDVGVTVRVAGLRFDDVAGPGITESSAPTTAPPAPTS